MSIQFWQYYISRKFEMKDVKSMNLDTLLQTLQTAPPDAPVVFTTASGEIGGGYHVTELKHASITGIDCGARISEWTEVSMQLLDGDQGEHMPAGKLTGILAQSQKHIPGLSDADLLIEFEHRNDGLRRFSAEAPELREGRVYIRMEETTAVCKPANEMGVACGTSGCCPPSAQPSGCCA